VFDSDPFAERLEFLGTPRVHLELTADQPVAYVIVRLNDVAPDGASSRVSYGVLNLTQRHSREHPEPVPVGERFGVDVKLNDVAYAFAPGHTMRLSISTCYWPVLWPTPEPVRLALHTGVSHLALPTRQPRTEDEALRPFDPPEQGERSSHTELRPSPLERTVLRDLTTNETTYTVFSDGGDFGGASLARLDAIDLTVGYTIRETYRIHEYEPHGARMTVEQQAVHRRGDWSTRLDCRTTLTATGEEFRLYATLETYEGDELFARREWDERIPRTLL